jgi:hypothetical protein
MQTQASMHPVQIQKKGVYINQKMKRLLGRL